MVATVSQAALSVRACDAAFLWQSMKGERLGEALVLVCSLFVVALYSSLPLSSLMPRVPHLGEKSFFLLGTI
jgi:hypothetical protein